MAKSFVEGIKTPFKTMVKTFEVTTKEGKKLFSYLHWALALALAGRPSQTIVETDGAVSMVVFGGGVVGVAETLPDGKQQVTWLPVLNGANQPIHHSKITSRELGDAISRCRAKAVAMVNGVGLPLYAHGLDDAVVFIHSLGVKPTDDLSTVQPHVSTSPKKRGEYLDWAYPLAAARLTDPNFRWEVLFHEVVDKATGEIMRKPYFSMGSGWGVAVTVTYKGTDHTEVLPIMGFVETETKNGVKLLDHEPLVNPDCHDWNRSVMRCLVKAIAVATGYGLNVYAKAEVSSLHVDPLPKAGAAAVAAPDHAANDPAPGTEVKPAAVAAAPAAPQDEAHVKEALIAKITVALKGAGRDEADLLKWLGYAGAVSLAVASVADLERGLRSMEPPASRGPVAQIRARVRAAGGVATRAAGESVFL